MICIWYLWYFTIFWLIGINISPYSGWWVSLKYACICDWIEVVIVGYHFFTLHFYIVAEELYVDFSLTWLLALLGSFSINAFCKSGVAELFLHLFSSSCFNFFCLRFFLYAFCGTLLLRKWLCTWYVWPFQGSWLEWLLHMIVFFCVIFLSGSRNSISDVMHLRLSMWCGVFLS